MTGDVPGIPWTPGSAPAPVILIGHSEGGAVAMQLVTHLDGAPMPAGLALVKDLLDQSARTQQQIDRAFSIFSELSSCKRQFPLLILGCEARTDQQRAIVLDLIARTEKGTSSRPIIQVKILIHAMWAQDDLADQELNYWDKLSSIISACSIVPSLV